MNTRSGSLSIPLVGCVFCLSSLLADEPGSRRKDEDDAKRIQGTWTVVELHQVNHQPTKDEREYFRSGGYKITITADKLIHSPDKSEGEYRLVPGKTPKVLELLVAEEVVARAIYDLKGDDLRICQGRKHPFGGEPEPPTDFDIAKAKPGTFPTLFVLRRHETKQGEK
jgi:uncharacterized protein (TIGR03067 family)